MLLKELFGGEIRLVPDEQGGLVAHWNLHTAALLRGVGTVGSGGRDMGWQHRHSLERQNHVSQRHPSPAPHHQHLAISPIRLYCK